MTTMGPEAAPSFGPVEPARIDPREGGRDDERAPRAGGVELDPDSPAAVLAQAQALTDRLATMHAAAHHADTVRLARAMALNVVDLLEGVARR